MIRRVTIGLCGLLAVAYLVLGPLSWKRDIFIWESDNAPSRYYRNYDNRPWKNVSVEGHTDWDPCPAVLAVGFCEGRFRMDYLSAVKLVEPEPGSKVLSTGERPPLPVWLDVPGSATPKRLPRSTTCS